MSMVDRMPSQSCRGIIFGSLLARESLATVLHLRVALAAEPLAALLSSSRTAMHRTLLKNRGLLKTHGVAVPPATPPPEALAILHARVLALTNDPSNKIKTTF